MAWSKEQYVSSYEDLVYNNRRITSDALESVLAAVDRYKLFILDELVDSPGNNELLSRLSVVYDASKELENKYVNILSRASSELHSTVDDRILDMLRSSNVNIPSFIGMTEFRLEVIALKQQTLAHSLTSEFADKLAREIQSLVLSGMTENTVENIAATLHSKLNFSSIYSRARAIAITELGSIGNAVAQHGIYEAQQYSENVIATWKHSLLVTTEARPAHLALDGSWVRKDEKFNVNGHYCNGPHDPNLPASEVVNCGCFVIPDVLVDDVPFGGV